MRFKVQSGKPICTNLCGERLQTQVYTFFSARKKGFQGKTYPSPLEPVSLHQMIVQVASYKGSRKWKKKLGVEIHILCEPFISFLWVRDWRLDLGLLITQVSPEPLSYIASLVLLFILT